MLLLQAQFDKAESEERLRDSKKKKESEARDDRICLDAAHW
jgi:hypothetical protein